MKTADYRNAKQKKKMECEVVCCCKIVIFTNGINL